MTSIIKIQLFLVYVGESRLLLSTLRQINEDNVLFKNLLLLLFKVIFSFDDLLLIKSDNLLSA